MSFCSPVAITANTIYVASYHTSPRFGRSPDSTADTPPRSCNQLHALGHDGACTLSITQSRPSIFHLLSR